MWKFGIYIVVLPLSPFFSPEIFEYPPDLVLEVPLSHPE
jgi:nitric oxide synthase oxygenase domain/subunit